MYEYVYYVTFPGIIRPPMYVKHNANNNTYVA